MPEPGPEIERTRERGASNDAQQRRLSVSCRYIDKLLDDIEQALHSAESRSPFPRYIADLTPALTRVVEDHIKRLRSQLLRALDRLGMKPNLPEIPVTRSVLTDPAFIDSAIEELRPSYMSGSERLTGALRDRLTHHVHILEMNADSYRLKQSRGKRTPSSER